MADIYVQGSFAFRCTHAEGALIEDAIRISDDLVAERDPGDPTPRFRAAFPPTATDDRWSGFCALFPDPDVPALQVDIAFGDCPDDTDVRTVIVSSMTDFQPETLSLLIQRCCRDTLAKAPIGFAWAMTCSKPRIGEFGGGWCAIFADRIEIEGTSTALAHALNGGCL